MTMHYIQHSKVILSYLEIWCTIKVGLISESFSLSQKVCLYLPEEKWYFVTKIVLTYCEKKLF